MAILRPLAVFLVLALLLGGSSPARAQSSPAGAIVALAGTPHLWINGEDGVLHWAGDTRALAGKKVDWGSRREVGLDELKTLRRGDPWLSSGLLKDGDPIYFVKWESDWPRPQLLHIQSIADVELFGINATNYGAHVLDGAEWGRRHGLSAAGLQRGVLAAAATQTAASPAALPVFRKPFAGDWWIGNFFDHELPFQFQDTNGYIRSFWGERVQGIDGHDGLDFGMPEGTPLLAVADGRVVRAGATGASPCPPLARAVSGVDVVLEHRVFAGGREYVLRSAYAHLSRVDVEAGQSVRQGQQIALSGNTGCSTGPHLHFEALLRVAPRNRFVTIDPYGWDAPVADPWAGHGDGAPSIRLWEDGHAPAVYAERVLEPNPKPTDNASVTITRVRWMGVSDERTPNNEFVELTLDRRYASADSFELTGFTLRNKDGVIYTFPSGFRIERGAPVRVYVGPGADSGATLYMRRRAPAFDNMGDCVRLVRPSGTTMYSVGVNKCE